MGVLKSLEKRPSVCDVMHEEKSAAESYVVNAWESNNSCFLPADLKQFYLANNGFLLTWKAKIKDDVHAIGRMEINPIEKLDKLGSGGPHNPAVPGLADIDDDVVGKDGTGNQLPHFDARSRIFELDPCRDVGKVCLVYKDTTPGVPARVAEFWFLDRSLRWHFLASSFAAYFRIMLIHLGLPQWPYLFTDIGVCPQVKQWYSLYAPARLELDEATPETEDTDVTSVSNAAKADGRDSQCTSHLDINRVFKGKVGDKKKPGATQVPGQAQNAAAVAGYKKKAGSPLPGRSTQAMQPTPKGPGSASVKPSVR